MRKKRLLYVGDYSNSGFGTVAKGLLRPLARSGEYEILQMGINYYDIFDFQEDWEIVPAGFTRIVNDQLFSDDAHGVMRLPFFLRRFNPDIVLVNNDYSVARQYMVNPDGSASALAQHDSIKVLYAPVDSDPVPQSYIDIAKLYDLNIAYTNWQRTMMAEIDPMFAFMPVLYHGYDADVYYPMDKDEAKERLVEIFVEKNLGVEREEFAKRIIGRNIVLFVGTNQFRKDLPCLFRAFAKLHDDYPDSTLIPHTNSMPSGYNGGWNLINLQQLTEVEDAILMRVSDFFTDYEMNVFYNAADVLAYPTRGEGFGLPSMEAMAVKTPVAATNFGAQYELHANGRGYPVQIVDVVPRDTSAASYLVLPDYRSLYKQLKFIRENPDHVAQTVETAYEWVKAFSWEAQSDQLRDILRKIPEKQYADGVQEPDTSPDSLEDPAG